MIRPIAIGLSPNVEAEDALKAVSILFSPWKYKKGSAVTKVQMWFEKYFSVNYAIPFASGRGALFAILQSIGVGKGDEVLVQAFTCVAVIDAILFTGATPIFVDVTKDLHVSLFEIKKKKSRKTKAIILQHTFGVPVVSKDVYTFLRKQQIFIVEDAAHTVGAKMDKEKLGTLGDVALFSFGRDKAFSSVSGGMVITKNKILGEKITAFEHTMTYPSFYSIFQDVLHPILFSFLILPLYDIASIGKVFLVIFQKLHILSLPIEKDKRKFFSVYCKKYPNALATLLMVQLKKIDNYNKRREKIGTLYDSLDFKKIQLIPLPKKLPLLRFPILVDNPKTMKSFFRKHTIYLGDWYSNIIDPKGTDLPQVGYEKGMCPTAEYIAAHIINLPTYPTLSSLDVKKISIVLKEYDKNTTY